MGRPTHPCPSQLGLLWCACSERAVERGSAGLGAPHGAHSSGFTDMRQASSEPQMSVRSLRRRIDGLSIYYELHGEGPPLMLLHDGLLTIELAFGDVLPARNPSAQRRKRPQRASGAGRPGTGLGTWPGRAVGTGAGIVRNSEHQVPGEHGANDHDCYGQQQATKAHRSGRLGLGPPPLRFGLHLAILPGAVPVSSRAQPVEARKLYRSLLRPRPWPGRAPPHSPRPSRAP